MDGRNKNFGHYREIYNWKEDANNFFDREDFCEWESVFVSSLVDGVEPMRYLYFVHVCESIFNFHLATEAVFSEVLSV